MDQGWQIIAVLGGIVAGLLVCWAYIAITDDTKGRR